MAETIFGNFSDHPGYRAVTKHAGLKAKLLMRRRSRIVQMQNADIRMAFQRLDDAEFLAGTQWSPEQIEKMGGLSHKEGDIDYKPTHFMVLEP